MQKNHLVLIFPVKGTNIKRSFSGKASIQWLYLGKNFFKRRNIEQELGDGFRRIDITRLGDEVARDIREEHVQWIDGLNRCYGDNMEWWFGCISSRNPSYSNLFQYCCYLEILERLWKENKRPELIVIESAGLGRAIEKWASRKDIELKMVHCNRLKFLQTNLLFFLRWANFFAVMVLRLVAAYVTRIYNLNKQGNDSSVIIGTFIHGDSISYNGTFKDRYFPYLHEYMSEKNKKVMVHPVLAGFHYNYFSIYRRMRISNTQFILQEDFLCFSDYLSALIYPLKVLRQDIRAVQFHDFDLYDILKEEKKEATFTQGMEAVLIYHLFLRLGKKGLRAKLIIDWYENQVINRALIAGGRRAFTEARIIGAQMFIHSNNFISLIPSQSEAEAKLVPHLLLRTSKYQCKVAQAFTTSIPCKPAAALRYSHVFNDKDDDSNQKFGKILVLLSFSIEEGVELLDTLKEVLGQIKHDMPILIKGHPDYGHEELIQAFGENNWPNRFEIYEGSLPDALKHAALVIASNSGSMVEAAAKGIPVIFLGRQTVLNQNILSSLKLENMDIMTECFSELELVEAIEKYQNLTQAEKIRYKEIGKRVRDLFFEPVNEESLLPFLDIEKE